MNYQQAMPRLGKGGKGTQMAIAQAKKRASVATFSDAIIAHGGRPLLRQTDQRVIRLNPAFISVTLTDNAVVAADLRLGSVWDKRTQGLYTSAASNLEAVLHLEGLFLYVNDGDYQGETPALKASLDNLAYIQTIRDGMTQNFPLRGHIIEGFEFLDFKQAAAAAEVRAIQRGSVWMLERPLRLDLKVDTFNLNIDSAINWGSGNIDAYVGVIGELGPREMPGAGGIKDASCSALPYQEDIGGGPTALGPLSYADLNVATGFQGTVTVGKKGF